MIKVEAAAINPSDILFMRGLYNVKLNLPYTPGWEGSGTVVAVGDKIKNKSILGKRVGFVKQPELLTYKVGGAMADFCVTNERSVMEIPDESISFEEASSMFVNPLTAICMVDRVEQLGAQACIVTAAASQIGRMIIQLLKIKGIKPLVKI